MSRPLTRAMVLAAGRGERMRPLTNHRPKPLIEVCGRPIIDRLLDQLAAQGIEEAVVNLHYLADVLREHLARRDRPRLVFSEEAELLDTGGGTAKALSHFGDAPFLVSNADMIWLDGVEPLVHRLASNWNDAEMDCLLLLQPTVTAVGYEGPGDFLLDPLGRLRRRREREVAPFVNAGMQIVHPRLFRGAPAGAFSFNLLWDRAIEAGRCFGLRHDGTWYHVGTPEAVDVTEQELVYELGAPRPRDEAA